MVKFKKKVISLENVVSMSNARLMLITDVEDTYENAYAKVKKSCFHRSILQLVGNIDIILTDFEGLFCAFI